MDSELYGCYTLKRGDRDASKKWGGQMRDVQEGCHVEMLQQDLEAFGVYIWKIDGDFGSKTERAVKLFQWNAKNLKKRLKSQVSVDDTLVYLGGITGIVDQASRNEISRWTDKAHQATGDLTRIKV